MACRKPAPYEVTRNGVLSVGRMTRCASDESGPRHVVPRIRRLIIAVGDGMGAFLQD